MGISLEELLEIVNNCKESAWYFIDCRADLPKEKKEKIKQLINDLLDELEDLK